ncbi:2OG-Fe(II) oxygenase family protein [Sphingomonas sp. RT2P30]|uniref:2OG-Fe(II) oxygenase family protein n=1 Tax=Parasphingomonas halimpatiens TaxID=3096162 RepID=UPI002FCBD7FC
MLTARQVSDLCDQGWTQVAIAAPLSEMVERSLAAWRAFFATGQKLVMGGDRRVPCGFVPLCHANGCDMKESFYIQPGYPLPGHLARETTPITRELGRIAQFIGAALDHPANRAIIETPRHGCLRVMRYPAFEGDPESTLIRQLAEGGALRAPAHQDLSVITLLPAASEPGLEVELADGGWLRCDEDPRVLTVLVGQYALDRSACFKRAATHRVANPETPRRGARMACAYFCG